LYAWRYACSVTYDIDRIEFIHGHCCFGTGTGTVRIEVRSPAIGGAAATSLDLYDVRGRLVRSLDSGLRAPGRFEVRWDRRDTRGATVAGGVYFLRLRAGAQESIQRLVLPR
jgi:hypothetical protein